MRSAGVLRKTAESAALVMVLSVAMTVACFGGGGCVATEQGMPPRGVVVSGPPPAPIPEQPQTPPPSPTAMWVAGYWHWTGMQYAWIPGHWENGPPGTTWAAPRYMASEGAYLYEAGGWRPAPPGSPPPPPVAPSPAAHANALR